MNLKVLVFSLALIPSLASAQSVFRCETVFQENPVLFSETKLEIEHLQDFKTQLQRLLKIDSVSHKEFDKISDAMKSLNPQEMQLLLKEVNNQYRESTFAKYKSVEFKGHKRVLDLIVSRSLNPYERFKGLENNPKQFLRAYDSFLKDSLSIAGILTPYSAKEVLSAVKWLQAQAIQQGKANPDITESKIIAYGSFFNGRAMLKISDIDTIIANKDQARFIKNLSNEESFAVHNLDHISSNNYRFFTQLNAAQINPIVFLISPSKIEVHIYPEVRQNEVKNDWQSKEPLIIRLK